MPVAWESHKRAMLPVRTPLRSILEANSGWGISIGIPGSLRNKKKGRRLSNASGQVVNRFYLEHNGAVFGGDGTQDIRVHLAVRIHQRPALIEPQGGVQAFGAVG